MAELRSDIKVKMQLVSLIAGLASLGSSSIGGCVYVVRLRRATFTSGTVIRIEERPVYEGPEFYPVIAFDDAIYGKREFVAGWNSFSSNQWHVGQDVSVKIIDGRPELHDVDLAKGTILGFALLGCVLIGSSFLPPPPTKADPIPTEFPALDSRAAAPPP